MILEDVNIQTDSDREHMNIPKILARPRSAQALTGLSKTEFDDLLITFEHIPESVAVWMDTGFQGMLKQHINTLIPAKAKKGLPLTLEQKQENRLIAGINGKLTAYECKLTHQKSTLNKSQEAAVKEVKIITQKNFLEFVG